jgi:hypothetical protein
VRDTFACHTPGPAAYNHGMRRSRSGRLVAVAVLLVMALVTSAPGRAHAEPFLLASAMASAASALIMLGAYLFVANAHGPESPHPGIPSGISCELERDGSTTCWPAEEDEPEVGGPAAPDGEELSAHAATQAENP